MPAAEIPSNENERLRALRSYSILDTAEDKDFDELTELASLICQTPIALISLVDKDRQWFKSHTGLAGTETHRDYSFCAYAINKPNDILIVENAKADPRFNDNPLVTGELDITFYAGVPLVNKEGYALGSLCVIDHDRKTLTPQQISALRVLAHQVIDKLELRKTNNEVQQLNRTLSIRENRLQSLITQAPVAIIVFRGVNLLVEAANPPMLELLNKEADIIGRPLLEGVPELEGQPAYNMLHEIYRTGQPAYGYDTKILLNRKGRQETGYFNFSYTPLLENGEVVGIIDMATEVTQQVLARKQVEDARDRISTVIRSADMGVWLFNIETNELTLSDTAKKINGLPAAATLTMAECMELVDQKHRDRMQQVIDQAVKHNTIFNEEYPINPADGSPPRWLRATGIATYDTTGKPISISGTTFDITAQKTQEQRKDDFISIASHELKTPLTALKASLQMMERYKIDTDQEMMSLMITLSNRNLLKITALIDSLLNATRINEDEMLLHRSEFVIAELLNNCCNHVRADGKYQLTVEGELDLRIHADEQQIDQVIVNLVNNAVKYASDSKEILLTILKQEDTAKVSVTDKGPGIPPEKLPHLFDRYYRIDHSGAAYSGLGLGLYICAEIIKRHGGEIGVESKLGEGSTFWFTLPL